MQDQGCGDLILAWGRPPKMANNEEGENSKAIQFCVFDDGTHMRFTPEGSQARAFSKTVFSPEMAQGGDYVVLDTRHGREIIRVMMKAGFNIMMEGPIHSEPLFFWGLEEGEDFNF